jgi:hypothetical protein
MNTLRDYFAFYNQRIFPLQILMAVLAILLVALLFILPGATTTLLLNVFLIITFGWIGVAFLFLMGDVRKRLPFIVLDRGGLLSFGRHLCPRHLLKANGL